MRIHPFAVVDPAALVGADVEIGPFAIVEAGASIGDRTRLLAHAVVCRGTTIGADCEVHFGAVIGDVPQIRGFNGPAGSTYIGAGSVIREHATVHRASRPNACTAVGRKALLLANSHVAHDCTVGDEVTLANGALLAGCVTVGDRAFVSGNVVVHQFARLGESCMIAGQARVSKDVPPFMLAAGDSQVRAVNTVGLRRSNVPPDRQALVRQAFRILYRSRLSVTHALAELQQLPQTLEITLLIRFIAGSRRGLCAGGPPRSRFTWQGEEEPEAEDEALIE